MRDEPIDLPSHQAGPPARAASTRRASDSSEPQTDGSEDCAAEVGGRVAWGLVLDLALAIPRTSSSAGAVPEMLLEPAPKLSWIPSKILKIVGHDDLLKRLSVNSHWARAAFGGAPNGRTVRDMA